MAAIPHYHATLYDAIEAAHRLGYHEIIQMSEEFRQIWLAAPKTKRNQAGIPVRLMELTYHAEHRAWVATERNRT